MGGGKGVPTTTGTLLGFMLFVVVLLWLCIYPLFPGTAESSL